MNAIHTPTWCIFPHTQEIPLSSCSLRSSQVFVFAELRYNILMMVHEKQLHDSLDFHQTLNMCCELFIMRCELYSSYTLSTCTGREISTLSHSIYQASWIITTWRDIGKLFLSSLWSVTYCTPYQPIRHKANSSGINWTENVIQIFHVSI